MSIFGWSLPPGCYTLPGEMYDETCMLCGKDAGDCECPECPVCGVQGDLRCYDEGHMVMTKEQLTRKETVEKEWEEDARKTAEAEAQYVHDHEEWLRDEAAMDVEFLPSGD